MGMADLLNKRGFDMTNESIGIISVFVCTGGLFLLRHVIIDQPKRRRRRARVKLKLTNGVVALVSITAYGAFIQARAQQTIFNVPSSDVLPKARVYGELDVTWKPNQDRANVVQRFSSFVPRVVFGAGGDVEVGLNLNGNIQPGPDSTTLSPIIKWRVYNGKDNGWSLIVGDHLFFPVRNQAYDAGNYVYAQVSKTFNGGRTRLTAGGYDFSANVVAANANRGGGQFGFEQAVNSKFTVQADWFTGKHASGYFTPGFYVKPHPKVTLYGGYSIGNANAHKGNHFFYTAIGINFN